MRSSSFIVLLVAALTYQAAGTCEMEFRCHDHKMNEEINDQIGVELKGHYTYLYMAQLFEHHTRFFPNVAKYFRAKSAEELGHAEKFIEYQNRRGGSVKMTGAGRYVKGSCASIEDLKTAFKCAMELEAEVTRSLTKLQSSASKLVVRRESGEPPVCSGVDELQEDDLRLTQPVLITIKRTSDSGVVTEITESDYTKCECGDEPDCRSKTVENFSYVELEDMIAHDFLGHQLEDTKEIANHFNTLKKMCKGKDNPQLESWLFDQHLEL